MSELLNHFSVVKHSYHGLLVSNKKKLNDTIVMNFQRIMLKANANYKKFYIV